MKSIHPAVHIILGIIVIISSIMNPDMIIFLVFGIGFLLWGGIQFLRRMLETKKKTEVQPAEKTVQNHPHQQRYKRCPNCMSVIEVSYRFCPYCGYGV